MTLVVEHLLHIFGVFVCTYTVCVNLCMLLMYVYVCAECMYVNTYIRT